MEYTRMMGSLGITLLPITYLQYGMSLCTKDLIEVMPYIFKCSTGTRKAKHYETDENIS